MLDTTRIHFVERGGTGVEPVCGNWSRSVNWTTEARVATCPDCLRRVHESTFPCSSCGRPTTGHTCSSLDAPPAPAGAMHVLCLRCVERLWHGSSPTPLIGFLKTIH